MYYQTELNYFINTLTKVHLPAVILETDDFSTYRSDYGLRQFIGYDREYSHIFIKALDNLQDAIIYKVTDDFRCHYFLLQLPKLTPVKRLLIGPYMTSELSESELMELAERYTIPASHIAQLNSYFEHVTILRDDSLLLAMMNTFGETLWEQYHFETITVSEKFSDISATIPRGEAQKDSETILDQMHIMEERYAFENQLIDIIARGQVHHAKLLLSKFSTHTFERRLSYPIRNMKNYGIISNTLMRKAAEKGGVHPIYLDSTSSYFARKIEEFTDLKDGQKLLGEMAVHYCRLVRKHATGQYSPLIQKTIAYIEADLSGDLRLPTLAKSQNVSVGYLATQFKRETGKTIVEHINNRRIDTAAELLQTTKLQVQTIAQYCGIADVNYFSKLFKKHKLLTPRQFREKL